MDIDPQKILDDEHLRLLRIGYLIAGAFNALWAFFPLIYVAMGIFIMTIGSLPSHGRNEPAPQFIGLFFAIIGTGVSLLIATLAVLKLLTAKALRERKSRTLCLVTAGITCLAIPYGTALGVATFLLRSRPSVRAQFTSRAERGPPVRSRPPSGRTTLRTRALH